jgi:hypothetical protein
MNALKQRLQVEPSSAQGLPTGRAIASLGKARRPGVLLPSRTYPRTARHGCMCVRIIPNEWDSLILLRAKYSC